MPGSGRNEQDYSGVCLEPFRDTGTTPHVIHKALSFTICLGISG